MAKFEARDRVVVANGTMFRNLTGRVGTVLEVVEAEDRRVMFRVNIDRLTSVPIVPFYEEELELATEETADGE